MVNADLSLFQQSKSTELSELLTRQCEPRSVLQLRSNSFKMQTNVNLLSGPHCACVLDKSHLAPAAVSHPQPWNSVALLFLGFHSSLIWCVRLQHWVNGSRSFESGDTFLRNVGNHLPTAKRHIPEDRNPAPDLFPHHQQDRIRAELQIYILRPEVLHDKC